jgi:Putative zinc-finger
VTEVEHARVEHTDVAAYALGLLEEPDRSAFAAHLEVCPRCVQELAQLAGMRDVLSRVDPADLDVPVSRPPEPDVRRLRRRPRDWIAVAAAAAALLLGGVFIGALSSDSGARVPDHIHAPAAQLLVYGERHAATDPNTGVAAVVGIEPRGFGTHVAFDLRGIYGPQHCSLIAVSRTGARETVATWGVPVQGYGVPGAPNPLVLHGATSFPPNDIASFEIITPEGKLLSVPVAA